MGVTSSTPVIPSQVPLSQDETLNSPHNLNDAFKGQPEGWAAVEHTFRDYDEQRVKDCKEDIDTLLTFVSARA